MLTIVIIAICLTFFSPLLSIFGLFFGIIVAWYLVAHGSLAGYAIFALLAILAVKKIYNLFAKNANY